MTVTLNGTSGITFNDSSVQNTAATGFGFKNRIINGGMTIDQRNAGASVTPTTGQYTLDRWLHQLSQTSKISVQRSTTAPAGFINSALITSLSAYSVGVNDYFNIVQFIEGLNLTDLGWGTANAQTVTISFWVRSSLTGTFGGAVLNSGQLRAYPFSYTISSANTWEQKTITVAGDTSGTWLTDNGIGLRLSFGLGAGSNYSAAAGSWTGSVILTCTGATSVVGTNGATFYITGVQLEKGSTATSFDYRPYGTELALCQRYYQKYSSMLISGYGTTGAVYYGTVLFPVELRATPTMTYTNATNSNCNTPSTNTVTTRLWRIASTVTSTGGAFSAFDSEATGAEL